MIAGAIDKLSYWHSGMDPEADWLILNPEDPPQLVLGTRLYLCVWWINTGTENFIGHTDLEITCPDNTKLAVPAIIYQDEEASSGNGWGVGFEGFPLNHVGDYKAEIILSSHIPITEIPFSIDDVYSVQYKETTDWIYSHWYAVLRNDGPVLATHTYGYFIGFSWQSWPADPNALPAGKGVVTIPAGEIRTVSLGSGARRKTGSWYWIVRTLKDSDWTDYFHQDSNYYGSS